jgi:hypothetical protein
VNQAPTAWAMKLVASTNTEPIVSNCNGSPSVEKP